ncbi:class I adenylate-forming enzyme family protein [Pseudonocardia acaciae]|uniref:class I adenylate-forming enzyme family protein n=1 Tax=Pseudonocardia acaciae TaxID=551276 RepID=UPI00048DE2BC|nr:class I adenylate-forming enzyme family protein [Pseudonocardia acaciae]
MSAAGSRAELTARLTAPGQEFEVAEREVGGVPMRVYTRGPQTLRELVLNTTAFGDHDFLIYQDERRSFAEHLRLASELARCLLDEYGLSHGDRVAVSMRNYPEWAPVFWAAQLAGLVVVPLNAWWSAPELCYALTDSGARLLVADAERTALLAPRRDELGRIPLVEVRGAGRPAPGVRGWDELVDSLATHADAGEPDVTVAPDDDATILYTSGTTGRPKGAIGTHRNHCTNTRNMVLGATVSAIFANGGTPPPPPDPDAPRPGTLCTFPFFHIAGINALCVTTALGARLATLYKWDLEQARELIRRERLTTASGVPTLMRQLVADGGGLDSLATIGMGGTSIPPDLIGRIDAEFGSLVAPGNGYGLTETTSAVATNTGADYVARPDSVGRCVPGADVRVVDPATGADLPDGEVGELWFRGPNVVRGYWNNPAATEEAFTDGWFHSGDLGRVQDGWLYVVDRLKDVVIRGGENIYCTEVEAALFEHPAVADVAVLGVPDADYGERAVAVVVAENHATADELRRHVAERLAAFKVPDHVIFRTEPLPRTQSGKVLKKDLRTELTEGRPDGA